MFNLESRPAFTTQHVGSTISIQGDVVTVDDKMRPVEWRGARHPIDCTGRIISVEEKLYGKVELDEGHTFENGSTLLHTRTHTRTHASTHAGTNALTRECTHARSIHMQVGHLCMRSSTQTGTYPLRLILVTTVTVSYRRYDNSDAITT